MDNWKVALRVLATVSCAALFACSPGTNQTPTDSGIDSGTDQGDSGVDGGDLGDTSVPIAFGMPMGSAVTMTIGAAGGTVVSADGQLTIIIPAGALAADTTIGIQPVTNTAPAGLGNSYLLTPDGTTFAQPAQIVLTFTDEQLLGTTIDGLGIGYQDDQGYWYALDGVTRDATAHTLSVSTPHLSRWSGLTGFQLLPNSASIFSEESVTLVVADCEPSSSSGPIPDGASTADDPCDGRSGLSSRLSGWSVDSIPGGNDQVGTVTYFPNLKHATYTAPAVMTKEVHAVSAELDRSGSRGHVRLVSNVTVNPLAYFIEAKLHRTKAIDICPVAEMDVDDSYQFSLNGTPTGVFTADSITNDDTAVNNIVIGGDYAGSTLTWNTFPEEVTVLTGNAAVGAGGYVFVNVIGTSTAGSCTLVFPDGYMLGPATGTPLALPLTFAFDPSEFGPEVVRITLPEDNYGWTISITR